MATPRDTGLRLFIVAVLAFVLTLSGVGRGFAGHAAPEGVPDTLSHLQSWICHSGPGTADLPTLPGRSVGHEGCDACALAAPAVLPGAPAPAALLPVRYAVVVPVAGRAAAPAGVWLRSQHRSRAPPSA